MLLFAFAAASSACGARVRGPEPEARAHASAPIADAGSVRPDAGDEQALSSVSPTPSGCGSASPAAAGLSEPQFTRIFEAPVRSFATGKPPRIAVLSGDAAMLFDGKIWRAINPPLPRDARLEVFVGRDNEPRLMGYGGEPSSAQPLTSHYRRVRDLRWVDGNAELGPLGGSQGGLYGVLGFQDPEIVCRPKLACLIKRRSGWTRLAAHDKPIPIVVSGGEGFALHVDRIERAGPKEWTAIEPPRTWDNPIALAVAAQGALWVVEATGTVYRRAGGQWIEVDTPLARPLSVWARSDNDVWLVGHDGAAHFDGSSFRCVPDVAGPLHAIGNAGPNLWFAGESGVWHAR